MENKRTDEIDSLMEGLAEAYVEAKEWSEKNHRSKVHIVKTHYKDLRDGIWKDTWNIEWDNDQDRIDFMDEATANFLKKED